MKNHDFSPEPLELFDSDGHLTEEAFTLLIQEKLDELQSLEVSEHLSYCDRCLERYTDLLCCESIPSLPDSQQIVSPASSPPSLSPMLEPPAELHANIMNQIQHRNRVFYLKKGSSLVLAASLTLVLWSGGLFSSDRLFNRAQNLLGGLHDSSQTILEHTSEISESIGDFLSSLQSNWSQRRMQDSAPRTGNR